MIATISSQDIAQKIRVMLRRDLKLGNGIALADDMALVGSTMDLDSLDILLLVTNIEKEFGIKIASQDVGKQAFATVGSLIAFVAGKCGFGDTVTPEAAGRAEQIDYLSLLPHREPFRFVTRIVKVEPGVAGEAVWSVKGDEAFFAGHFPGAPLVPGVLIAEALAQLSGVVGAADGSASAQGKLAQVDVRFDASVMPPADISLRSKLVRTLGALKQFEVVATSKGATAGQGTVAIAYAAGEVKKIP